MTADGEVSAGTDARTPSEFAWADWKAIGLRVVGAIGRDRVSLVSAGVAFYAMLALFPALAAMVGLYGIVADPVDIADQLDAARPLLPQDAYELVESQLRDLTSTGPTTLQIASIIAIAVAFFSARAGVSAMVQGLNIVYSETNDRGFILGLVVDLSLALILMLMVLCALAAIILVPAILGIVEFGDSAELLARILRWPIVLTTVILGVGVLYRYGPSRRNPKVSWISWGAVLASAIWLVGSMLFSWYIANFANYNETYGSLGAIVGLLMWFYVSAFIVLVGAEFNAEMEHQTRLDSTVGPDRPMGQRGAVVADTLPEEDSK